MGLHGGLSLRGGTGCPASHWNLEAVAETGALCREMPWSSSIQTATHKHAELILDAFKCIKPVELRVYQLLQTAVELPGTSNHTSCRVQHSLQLVSDSLWSPLQ